MRGNIGNMMKQAQMVQENMKQMQEKLAAIEVEGQSGAGMVKVIMTCRHDVKKVNIDNSLMGDDKEMLEDLRLESSELIEITKARLRTLEGTFSS